MTGLAGALSPESAFEVNFETFFRSSFERLLGSMLMVTKDVGLAEDALQEAYTRAFQRWDRLRSYDRPDLWVLRVATNLAINNWSKRRRERDFAVTGEPVTSARTEPMIEQIWLEWGLAQLSPQQRIAFVLHHAEGWSVEAVARSMGTAETTVGSHLERARRRLRTIFAPDRTR